MPDSSIAFVPSQQLSDARLSQTHIHSWREQGFALVHDLLPQSLLVELKHDALHHYPAPGTEAARSYNDFSSGQSFVFPSRSAAFNAVTLHPALLQAAADLLYIAVMELRLTQSDLWPKYGSPDSQTDSDREDDNSDQRMHCDYPNHSLVHPPQWDQPEAVEMIVYLNNYEECEGATAVVPRSGPEDPAYPWPIVQTPGVGDLAYINDRRKAEAHMAEQDPQGAAFRAQHLYPERWLPSTNLALRCCIGMTPGIGADPSNPIPCVWYKTSRLPRLAASGSPQPTPDGRGRCMNPINSWNNSSPRRR